MRTAGDYGRKIPPSSDELAASAQKIVDLRARRLPQMVNWWDASVLALVGVRTIISGTIGSYADQRPMQAAADAFTDAELQLRHDYRNVVSGGSEGTIPAIDEGDGRWSITTQDEYGTKLKRGLRFDGDEALWVDFIADLGDGFEATYAMAYLMAQDSITLDVPDKDGKSVQQALPAGEIMIMGGDLAYPNATVEEYRARCIAPYDAAFQLKDDQPPPRKLFFIAGNHDWYDGLAAFTSVFCSARDRHADGKGLVIGGWQAEQRRSYFALALPHGWWFWGIDLALNVTIDEAQKSYFEMMSEKTKPGEKIIIIVHAPVWQSMHDSPLHEVSKWARERGAEVVAMLAGDLHFYSRFHSINPQKPTKDEPALPQELQLIVSGGGGAFLHPTHQVRRKMKVHWTLPKPAKPLPRDHKEGFKDTVATITADEPPVFDKAKPFHFQAPHIYPSPAMSRLLSLKNLFLPFHNRKFAYFMGALYLVYAWVFQISTLNPSDAIDRALSLRITTECRQEHPQTQKLATECFNREFAKYDAQRSNNRITALENKLGLESNAPLPVTTIVRPTLVPQGATLPPSPTALPLPWFSEVIVDTVRSSEVLGGATAAVEMRGVMENIVRQGGWPAVIWRAIWPGWDTIWPQINTERTLYAMLSNPAFFFMVIGLYVGLIYFVGFDDGEFVRPKWLKWPLKIVIGGVHAWAHIFVLLTISAVLQKIYFQATAAGQHWLVTIIGVTIYSLLFLLIGGIVGGMLFGVYWVLTSVFGRLHMESFGALGISGYKNFLRLRIEKDKITVYAIGLDQVPGRRGWRALTSDDDTRGHNPLIKPTRDLRPHLIEPPYEIKATAPKPAGTSNVVETMITGALDAAKEKAAANPAWKKIWS